MIELVIVVGSNELLVAQRRDALLAAFGTADIERVDLRSDLGSRVVDLVGSATLFGTPRCGLLDHLDASVGVLDVLEEYGAASDTRLVATFHGKPVKVVLARLEALGIIDKVTEPTRTADRVALVTTMATREGITLDRAGANLLATRLGGDWGRVGSVLTQLAVGGFTSPSLTQLEILVGTAVEDAVPWGVTDAAAQGNLAAVLAGAQGIEPVAVSSWVVAETLRLVEVAQEGWSADEAASALAIHSFRAQKLVRWATRLDRARLAEALATAAALDLAAKSSQTAHRDTAVIRALAHWAQSVRPS